MLHAVLDYARSRDAVEPGFKPKSVRWLINFSPDGQFLDVFDAAGGDKKSKGRTFRVCPDLTSQEIVSAGGGCRHFLVDSVDVVALLAKDEVDDKLTAKHEYFVSLLRQAGSELESVAILKAIATALGDETTLATIRSKLAEKKAKPMDVATFAIVDDNGAKAIVEDTEWHDWWRTFRSRLADQRRDKKPAKKTESTSDAVANRMQCVLTGVLVEAMPTHNKIEGLSDVGGLSMGDALTSFDKEAFCSFGLQQGENAAMSEQVVKTYSATLNDLIKTRGRKLASAKVVYWYSGELPPEDDLLEDLFGLEAPDDEQGEQTEAASPPSKGEQETRRAQAENKGKKLLAAIQSGERPDLAAFRYYAVTVSANSGRVVIRDWMEGSFAELAAAIDEWFSDLAIIGRDGRRVIQSHKFGAVLAAPLRDLKDATGPLVAALWRCALKRQPIPHHVMAQTLNRVRIDLMQGESARHARLGLLKAYCNRNERLPKMSNALNELETNPAYLCGRVMAILARIQNLALPGVGAGIVQRYYAAASATPALVLGRLIRNAQIGHLPKIENEGLRRWFERRLADVWSQMKSPPPRVLTLEEQTLFAMGYYHQMADRGGSDSGSTQPSDQTSE